MFGNLPRIVRRLALLSVFVATPGLSLSASELARVGDFSLLDQAGKFHQLSWYGDQKAVVVLIHANGDAAVRNAVTDLNRVQTEFTGQDVVFFMLNPMVADNRQNIAAEVEKFNDSIPVLVDESQLVAESLGADRAGEVFVIDPTALRVVYRGPVGQGANNFLKQALSAHLSGQEIASNTVAVTGSAVEYPARKEHAMRKISYTEDIVPILQDNCVGCHHQGGIAPWSMSSHKMIQGWSPMIREVVMTRRMPPGQIDPHLGLPIDDVVEITPEEKQRLVHWIDAGAKMDSGEDDPLLSMRFDDDKFKLGEPDMVFKVTAQSIPATGIVDYRYIPVELNLDKDIWIQAMEFVPGDPQVLHHVIAYLSSPVDKSVRGRNNGSPRGENVAGFAPGRQPDQFRDNSGRLIPKGSNLLLQMHYTTSGKETVDETEVGIYIHDEPPTYIMSGAVAGQRRFLIPAHAKEHKLQGEQLIEKDAYLYSMTPHMHFRGKYMSYTAEYPDGTSEVLLSVPKYEFNWQFSYELKEPLFLPAGTRLVANGAMDNSDRNRANPDPTRPVHFGLQTKHEMFFGFITLRYVGATPQSLDEAAEDDVASLQ